MPWHIIASRLKRWLTGTPHYAVSQDPSGHPNRLPDRLDASALSLAFDTATVAQPVAQYAQSRRSPERGAPFRSNRRSSIQSVYQFPVCGPSSASRPRPGRRHATIGGVTAPLASRASRALVDRCPGLLRPHRAADGALIRLRLPGGRITAAALASVSAAAVEFGDGQVQLTSRGNLPLRGVQVDDAGDLADELVGRISAAGLLPSATHELVRNIVCSPLTGRIGGQADLRPVLAELDQLIGQTPELAALPGRFLFGLDDGSGDIAGLLDEGGMRPEASTRTSGPHPYGVFRQRDGRALLSLVVPLALLDASQVAAVVAAAQDELIVTPWRGLLIPDLPRDHGRRAESLLGVRLSLDAASGWSQLSACTGAPGCVNGHAPTRPVAAEIARAIRGTTGLPVHVVACERRCGAPAAEHIEVLLGPSTWQVELRSRHSDQHIVMAAGSNTAVVSLASTVAQARIGS